MQAITGKKFPPSAQILPLAPRTGERDPFELLLARHRPQLYRVALRQLGDPDDAQDALQEALLLAFRHRDQFQGRAELGTWLTRIVINASLGLRRRRRAHPTLALEQCPAALQLRDHHPDPEARCAQRERRDCLLRWVARLSPPLRSAIQLHELDGLSLEEAAASLGVKPATFKCRLFRGRARLAALATQTQTN